MGDGVAIALAAALLSAGTACTTQPQQRHTGDVYFGNFLGVEWCPLQLSDELSEADLESHPGYLVAHYDGSGRLLEVQKILDQEPDFRVKYSYDSDGQLIECEGTNPEGRVTILKRDARGRLVEQLP